jgi:RNA polymerase sigma-70 factor (ECF subfamily)
VPPGGVRLAGQSIRRLEGGAVTLAALIGESAEAFGELANPYRRELLVHCYRMLGSVDDAEDAVQEALVRAWHGRATFQRAVSFRAWLYRIATNACLDAIDRRKRGGPGPVSLEMGPAPIDLFEDTAPGPEARYDSHESVSLAFLTALQVLPPRQRAVLILRDVLSWHAAEVASLLDLSVPAVNSALHRARTTVAGQYAPASAVTGRAGLAQAGKLRSLLERYVRAWEAADVAGLVALLRDDAVVSMPPGVLINGAAAIATFLAGSVFVDGTRIRLRAVRSTGGPTFVIYSGAGPDPLRAYAVLVLDVAPGDGRIARISVFVEPGLIARFGLPAELAA